MAQKKKKSEPLTYVAQSAIHGKGLFAARTIPKDTLILAGEGVRTKRDGMHVLWLIEEDDTAVGTRITNDVRFMNHSNAPNAEFYNLEIWSLRKIKKDEEITADYGSDWADVD